MDDSFEFSARRRWAWWVALAIGGAVIALELVILQVNQATGYEHWHEFKDPERATPGGPFIVAPADGTVLYVKRVTAGTVPEMVKHGIAVPITDHLKTPDVAFGDGYLVGIFMNTDGVHVNRVPISGTLTDLRVYAGPHVSMDAMELDVIRSQLVPGQMAWKRLLGDPPFDLSKAEHYVMNSARETLLFRDVRGHRVAVTRIADYHVGKILTWIEPGDDVKAGDRMGMITWGSQTDVYFEASDDLRIRATVGDYVLGGESILASY